MVAAALLSLSLALPSQSFANDVGTLAQFKATIRPTQGDSPLSGKEFDLTLLTIEEEAADVAWAITSETGLAALAWPARVGSLKRQSPIIRVDWGDGDSEFKLPALLLHSVEAPLDRGMKQFRVGDETWLTGDPKESSTGRLWKIVRKGGIGGGASATIDESGWPTELTAQFTVGRGFPYELTMTRTKLTRLTLDETEAAASQLGGWYSLVDTMGFAIEEEATPKLNRAQLKEAVERLNELGKQKTPWVKAIAFAQKSLREQGASSVAIEVMVEKAIGKKVWPAKVTDLRDKAIDASSWKEGVVVLHFWTYQETPLKQPYGQVGFLDFLSRKEQDVQVVGVLSHEAVQQNDTRREALRSARKFRDFMNVSYPIVVADELLEAIGDPRKHSSELPMFVIVGPTGKVEYVKVGLFDVDPQRGLTELEDAIKAVAAK
jgi:hypothetical protein